MDVCHSVLASVACCLYVLRDMMHRLIDCPRSLAHTLTIILTHPSVSQHSLWFALVSSLFRHEINCIDIKEALVCSASKLTIIYSLIHSLAYPLKRFMRVIPECPWSKRAFLRVACCFLKLYQNSFILLSPHNLLFFWWLKVLTFVGIKLNGNIMFTLIYTISTYALSYIHIHPLEYSIVRRVKTWACMLF